MTVQVQSFFHEPTNTVSYLVTDPATNKAAIIDPVLDYEHSDGTVRVDSAQAILDAAREAGAEIQWILETHAHADHVSAAHWLKDQTGAPIGIGEHIRDVQKIFAPVFNLHDISGNGSEFDRLFADGEVFQLGEQKVEVLHTPGHTPACIAYLMGDVVFVGDTLFMPDYGTARADFPGGDAATLYRSIQRLLTLPPHTRMFLCHDYKAPGRDEYVWETTVGAQRAHNVHVREGISEAEYVAARNKRDATLSAPQLILPSIQINIRAGTLPEAESNGVHYLKIPLTLKDNKD